MKKFLLLCSVYCTCVLYADELSNILSDNKNLLFDYELRSNSAKSDMLENAWINPIMLQYTKRYSRQFTDRKVEIGSFTVSIDQPIFRSGGIYFAIKYAQALRGANEAEIRLKKKEAIVQAVKLLFEIKKIKLELKKLALLIKNDAIDIRQKRESYHAGLVEGSFLDQALLKRNQDETKLLELETTLITLRQNFSLLSDKKPEDLMLPNLHLISKARYKRDNIALERDRLRAKEKEYQSKMTWAKYLPTLSVQARYTNEDLNPLFARPGIEEQYYSYGFSLSMPLDINMFSDIEASKVDHLKAQTEVIEREDTILKEYHLAQNRLLIIDKKIALAKRNEILYKRLYKSTKNLQKAGEKTSFDTALMKNSLEIKRLEQKIFQLDKQILLLELYAKVENEI